MKTRKLVLWAIVALFICTISIAAFAQTPAPTPAPQLTTATVVITVMAVVLGIINQLVQTGKLFNNWPLPTAAGPYIVILGSFIGGVYAYFQQQNPLVLNQTTIFYGLMQGLTVLLAGAAPGVAVHHFGGQVNKARPAAITPNPPAKSDTNSTLPAPPPSSAT